MQAAFKQLISNAKSNSKSDIKDLLTIFINNLDQEQVKTLIGNLGDFKMPNRALKDTQVREKTGISKSAMYRLMAAGKFPAPMRISERCVRWSEKAIDEWIEARQSEVK